MHVKFLKVFNIYMYSAKIAPISAVEVELSLFAPDILHDGVAATCADLSIPVVAYSPLGRGILAGRFSSLSEVPEGEFLHFIPKYQDGAIQQNIKRINALNAVAQKNGLTPAQLALGWIKALPARPGMPSIIPIPGGTTPDKIEQNVNAKALSTDVMDEIDRILAEYKVVGTRY